MVSRSMSLEDSFIVPKGHTKRKSCIVYSKETIEFTMTSMIGNEILDIGSRKARRQRGDPFAPPMLAMGAPGQFDLPNVPDVSCVFEFR